ncbi:hypothetical protein BDB01DRAFT_789420 [Pilobolus umbonatus]|nr:hypothetical protein BDB01DRAFT_789420 [Pilobolus umbonatus]
MSQTNSNDESSSLPPPYSVNNNRPPSQLTLDGILDINKTSIDLSSLQLKMVLSTINYQASPYDCSSVLEDRFLLLGHQDGIQLIDMQNMESKPEIIIRERVKKMFVIKSCRVVLMITNRSKKVRCYSYDCLLRLIYAVLSLNWSDRHDKQFDIPSHQAWEHMAAQAGKAPEDEQLDDTMIETKHPSTEYALNLKERLVKKKEEKRPSKSMSTVDNLTLPFKSNLFYVCNDIILEDFYYKLPDSKDAMDVQIYQTSQYVFAAVIHRDKLVLWQRKRDHPLRPFCRLKVFWIPTEAKSVTFADDRSTLRHIIAVFSNEATIIELRNSKVQTVPLDPTLERIYQTTWIRDQYEHQLKSPRSPNSPTPSAGFNPMRHQANTSNTDLSSRETLNIESDTSNPFTPATTPPMSHATSMNENTITNPYPTLPASLSVPPIQWTSLIQLPFYPDSLPATTLTTDYSTPPSYSTVITSLSTAPPDPVALPSAVAPQLFFATLLKQSYIIDLSGALFSTQVYRWSEAPVHIEFIQIDATLNEWYAVGFGTETVEIIHFKTAESVQRVMYGIPVKFLGRWDMDLPKTGKKDRTAFKSLIWSCEVKYKIYVYMWSSVCNQSILTDTCS